LTNSKDLVKQITDFPTRQNTYFLNGEKALSLKDRIFPKEKNFYKMLSHQASKTLEGIEALGEFVENQNQKDANRVKEIEKEADELRRVLVEELHKTFVIPMDREDIYALSRAIDDIVDYATSTVDEMEIYEVLSDAHLREMVDILRKAALEIRDAVKILEAYPNIAMEHAVKAKFYENTMEKAYHSALADLFKKTDTVYMLKMREVYRHLSNAADRSDEAANIICSIVMKAT
jgi:predicted phosphate transport protein (TIGR00153 family)